MATLWCKFRNALRAFARAREGNVAVIFGIAAIPLIGFVGAAVDYGHANAVKTAMQAALDSTALMLSREASKLNQTDLNSKALAYFNAMFNRSDVQPGTLTINASYTTTGGTSVTVSGNVYVPTSFVTVIGFPQIDVGASSTAKWGSNRLRVALVLDNTGSMAERRQDHRAQDRDRQSADAAQERGERRRRRLCLDHPVREGRVGRPVRLHRILGQLDLLGRRGENRHEVVGRPQRLLQHFGQIDPQPMHRGGGLFGFRLHQSEQLYVRRQLLQPG